MSASVPPSAGAEDADSPAEDELKVVRYSLPQMLAEIRRERATGSFAMEKLEQAEIGKLFAPAKRKRRVNPAT